MPLEQRHTRLGVHKGTPLRSIQASGFLLFVVGGTVMGFVGGNEVVRTGYVRWCIAHCSLSMEYAPQVVRLPTVMIGYLN